MRDTLDTFRLDSTREDILQWMNDVHGVFSVWSAWDSLRVHCPRVTWYHIVWFCKCIPCHAFILWLAIQGGLYTQTKLICFGLVQSMCCVLCGCSERVWHSLHAKCNLPWVQQSWPNTLSWMEQFLERSMHSIVIRLMFVASIYAIWHERNARTHGEAPKHESVVI
ncbi:uncharacterized protein LOC111366708 [Olea europaea var. sylvestris]|uniref:uncharacterized protein LOC111366708 n=1 Tax=Olea europaea var. sylvestris TaxID=158386 RepID=UPI000C1D5DBC|nr:uncharacterized protein LOC111366708 [Olea europaea var. sylvestris]